MQYKVLNSVANERKARMARSERMRQSLQARMSLDAKLPAMRVAADSFQRPRGGWIQTVRIALGMSVTDLASRLSVAPSTIHRLEASEAEGVIRVESLMRVAEELGCDFVYALVPRQDLETTVNTRALELAAKALESTQTMMQLEQQGLQREVLKKLIEQKARELAESSGLWREKN